MEGAEGENLEMILPYVTADNRHTPQYKSITTKPSPFMFLISATYLTNRHII